MQDDKKNLGTFYSIGKLANGPRLVLRHVPIYQKFGDHRTILRQNKTKTHQNFRSGKAIACAQARTRSAPRFFNSQEFCLPRVNHNYTYHEADLNVALH